MKTNTKNKRFLVGAIVVLSAMTINLSAVQAQGLDEQFANFPELVPDDEDGEEPNLMNSDDTGVTDDEEPNLLNPGSSGTSDDPSNPTPPGGTSGGGGGGGGGGRTVFQCNDGADNDGDGLVDYPADPGCSQSRDDTENTDAVSGGESTTTPVSTTGGANVGMAECNDGIDNDGDGLADFPADPDCNYKMDPSEGEPMKEAAPEKKPATKLTSSGPAESILIATIAGLGALYFTRKQKQTRQ